MYWEHMAQTYFIGRLVKDMDLSYTSSGIPVGKFTIAVQKSKKVNDKWEKITHFFDCEIWNKDAEEIQPEMKKGVLIHAFCETKQDRWEKDGQKKSKIKFTATRIMTKEKKHQKPGEDLEIPF